MIEREIQTLLWKHPERLLGEQLRQFAWELSSPEVGRADLVFENKAGDLLVVEVKAGKLPRGAISQVLDYYGILKLKHPTRAVELMVVANSIPAERRLSLERHDIDAKEISELTLRRVAKEVGFVFESERNVPINELPHGLPHEGTSRRTVTPTKGPAEISSSDKMWEELNSLQLGEYARTVAKQKFAECGLEVRDLAMRNYECDFQILTRSGKAYLVKVRSVRDFNYVFFEKRRFCLREELLIVVIYFQKGTLPKVALIPSNEWKNPRGPFKSHDYPNGKSKPEWGLQVTKSSIKQLSEFEFERTIKNLL